MAKRSTKPKEPSAPPAKIYLRPASGAAVEIESSPEMERLAMQWSYIVRNRRRWVGDDEARAELSERATSDLRLLGIGDGDLLRLASAGLVEIGVDYVQESAGWETRVLPWEHLVHFATRGRGKAERLLVVRHLNRAAKAAPSAKPAPPLFVESAPGALAAHYSFQSERYAVLGPFEVDPMSDESALHDPTEDELRAAVVAREPAIVHLAGVDAFQGAELLGERRSPKQLDGYYMADARRLPTVVERERLAKALTAAKAPPRLVTTNFHNSAPRIGALAVAEGAGAAIGFQDEIDDTMAELFHALFYQAIAPDAKAGKLGAEGMLTAFFGAFERLRSHAKSLRGAGIVFWSAESIAGTAAARAIAAELKGGRTGATARLAAEGARRGLHAAGEAPADAGTPLAPPPAGETASDEVSVHIAPNHEINYALLHNRRNLFQKFEITPLRLGRVGGVEVKVELHVGGTVFPFRGVFEFDREAPRGAPEHPDINERVRVPLTWDALGDAAESIQTTLYAEVCHRQRTLLRRTFPVTLLPANEWKDTKRDSLWLPSFVLPRDPAVQTVLDRAERHLKVLADNPGESFVGYIGFDPAKPDPYEGIDRQVRAIWSALQYDFPMSYINPPPAYSESSQRLRSPCEILERRRATCIDLALLVASCLEYIEIFPTIFLTANHAFPGYWRSLSHFASFSVPEQPTATATASAGALAANEVSWLAGAAAFPEIEGRVNRGELRPLESTYLTNGKSYREACDQGAANLKHGQRQFDALLDIRRARVDPRYPVTPLPLRNSR